VSKWVRILYLIICTYFALDFNPGMIELLSTGWHSCNPGIRWIPRFFWFFQKDLPKIYLESLPFFLRSNVTPPAPIPFESTNQRREVPHLGRPSGQNFPKAKNPGIHLHHPGSQGDYLKEYSPLEVLNVNPLTKTMPSLRIKNASKNTLPKFNMGPEHDGFQKESLIPGCHFQVPC